MYDFNFPFKTLLVLAIIGFASLIAFGIVGGVSFVAWCVHHVSFH